jgi:hypothetical protein
VTIAGRLGWVALGFVAGAIVGAWSVLTFMPQTIATAVFQAVAPPAPEPQSAGSDAAAPIVAASEAAAAPAAGQPLTAEERAAVDSTRQALDRNQIPPAFNEMLGRLMMQDRDFEAQKRDEDWAKAQEEKLRRLLERSPGLLPPGGTVARIDCRTTMCLLHVAGVTRQTDRLAIDQMSRGTKELFESLKYGVSSSVQQAPDRGTDDYFYILRPDVHLVPDAGGRP